MAKAGQDKLLRRVLSDERGEGSVARRLRIVATPEPRLGARHTPSIDANLLSPQTRINLPFPLGPLSVSVLKACLQSHQSLYSLQSLESLESLSSRSVRRSSSFIQRRTEHRREESFE